MNSSAFILFAKSILLISYTTLKGIRFFFRTFSVKTFASLKLQIICKRNEVLLNNFWIPFEEQKYSWETSFPGMSKH